MKKQDSPGPEKVWEKEAEMRRRANPAAETFIFLSGEGCPGRSRSSERCSSVCNSWIQPSFKRESWRQLGAAEMEIPR